MERAIYISSINRVKTGEKRPDNFLIKFNPPLKVNPIKNHFLAIDRLTMTYSWIISEAVTIIIQPNTVMTEELIRILSLSKMECIHILISTITFISIWRIKIITQLIKEVIKYFTSTSILLLE